MAAQFTISGARARSIPVFHVDIQLYAIGSTDVGRVRVGHEKVMEITTMWGSLRLAPISHPLVIKFCPLFGGEGEFDALQCTLRFTFKLA